jgi:hypothetical protein
MFADPALVTRQLGQGAFRLLVTDVHTLFDRGYVTVTPDYKFRVSRRLENEPIPSIAHQLPQPM